MYFETILNKNGYFQVEILLIIFAGICLGVQGHMLAPLRKFCKYGAVWCVLKYILIRVCIEKFPKN